VEAAEINFRRGAKRYVSGRAWNLQYGAISRNACERLFTLTFAFFFPTALFITVPPVYDHRPGRFVKHIDFNHFRTIGMRRSLEEGVSSRFVTAERLGVILKVSPNQQRPQFGSILMSFLPSPIRRHPT
jgi:hypothetical protein